MISNVPLNSVKEPRKRDNPLINQMPVTTAYLLIKGICTLHKDLRITITELFLLLVLHHSWSVDGQGMNVNEICDTMDYRSDFWAHVQRRVNKLKSFGMIEVVGTGRNSSVLYAPSKDIIAIIDAYYLSKL